MLISELRLKMAMLRSVMKLRPVVQQAPAAFYHEKVHFQFHICGLNFF